MKGASFARRYFFLIGASLLKMQKIDSLNRPKSVSFKEQKGKKEQRNITSLTTSFGNAFQVNEILLEALNIIIM